MNERLMDFLWRSEVARLPESKKRVYEFMIEAEDALAEEAVSADEFCQLLLENSPVHLAMNYFGLPYEVIVNTLMETEEELHHKINHRLKKVMWIDFTDFSKAKTSDNSKPQLFLFRH